MYSEENCRRLRVAERFKWEYWVPTAEEGENGGSTLGMLSGTWRLVYSSGFASGSLGGQRPGPPAALVPVTIGQVRPISLAGFRYATPNLKVAILL